MRNLRFVVHHSCTALHYHQQYTRAPISLYHCQHLLSIVFLMMAILTGMSGTSLWFWLAFPCKSNGMLSDFKSIFFPVSVGHLWCLFWRNVYSSPYPISNWVISYFYYWVVGVPYIFWSLTPYLISDLQNVPHSVCHPSTLLTISCTVKKLFSLAQTHLLFILLLVFLVS